MSKFFDTVRIMKKVLTKKTEKPKGYDVIATVTGVDGETAWVSIPSGVPETPAQVGVAVKQGDKVMVRVSGGRARVIGNVTSPPTDDTIAQEAHRQSILAYNAVKNVNEQVIVIDEKVTENAEQMAQTVIQINSDIEGLQEQIDGNITSWFYAVDPTLNNPPAIDWLEEGTEAVHLGDLYYNTETGYAWRWMYDGDEDEYGWMRITDVDVVKALADAAKAQDTADSKRRVFVAQPTPPYDIGDLWVQGSNGDILRSTAKRETGASYVAADWIKASKYTDDTVAQQALTSANGKNTVYHSATRPTGGTYKVGDTWFNSSEGYAIYTWNGSQWVKEELGSDALKDLAITNAKIADATIQSAKIAGLDVGKLTGGYIDAIHINAKDFKVGDFVNDGTYLTEADQLTVDSIEYAYQLSTSGTAVPQGTWQSTPQAPTETQFAWTRTTTNYSDGTSAVTYTVGGKQGIQGIQGQQGIQGIQGETGDDGTTFTPSVDANGNISWTNDGGKTNPTTRNITGPQGEGVTITSTTTRYQSGTSPSSAPTGSWLTSPPTVSAGNYLWTRVIVNYSDGNSTTSYSVARQGENGTDVTSQYVTYIDAVHGVRVMNAANSSNYSQITAGAFDVYQSGNIISHQGYDSGVNASSGTSTAPYYTFGTRKSDTASTRGNYSFAEGYNVTASGYASHAEGYKTVASGHYSHAEGMVSTARESGSHAEGGETTASRMFAHAEGYASVASGECSHAAGDHSEAAGDYSHASGLYSYAGYDNQFVIGQYNKNKSNDVFEIGWGNATYDRRNIFEVDTSGNVMASGTIAAEHSSVTDISSSVTSVTTGTKVSAKIVTFGKVASLHICFKNTSSIAAGSDVFAATLASAYRPALDWATGGGYYSKAALQLAISSSGAITVRNASAAAVTCSANTNVVATYILA